MKTIIMIKFKTNQKLVINLFTSDQNLQGPGTQSINVTARQTRPTVLSRISTLQFPLTWLSSQKCFEQ